MPISETLRLKSHSAAEYAKAMADIGAAQDDLPGRRMTYLPDEIGRGVFEHVPFCPGFELSITRYSLQRGFSVQVSIDRPMFSFGCLLNGSFRLKAKGARAAAAIHRRQGFNMWASGGEYRFHTETASYLAISLLVSADFIRDKLALAAQRLPLALEQAVAHNEFATFLAPSLLSERASAACLQITSASPSEPLYRLLLDSDALTILREQLLSITGDIPFTSAGASRAKEEDKIYEVNRLLQAQPQCSPSLMDLARTVGLNEYSLKRAFRRVYGCSVYAYVRRIRMEMAAELLEAGEHSVAEIAEMVGYTAPGRFAAAFGAHHGMTPKATQLLARSSARSFRSRA